jgi:glycosyltransferase involved in cell wall biosynthesis
MGSTHIQFQDRILREECELLGLPADAISPELVQRGILEYECADCISVISTFAQETFAQEGIPPAKVKKAILGVDTERFTPTGAPDDSYFDVLFVGALSSRKGITYLLQAFEMLPHARKRLTLVGDKSAQTEVLLATSPPGDNVRILGHVPQLALRDIMSRSHVLVLPSIEDGFGMVMSQAMACGCPVIATVNTGGRDIIRDRITGYIVPIRSPGRICEALIDIAGRKDGESLRKLVRQETESMGGWAQYGAQMVSHYQDAIGGPR